MSPATEGQGGNVLRHTVIGGTLPLAETTVSADSSGQVELAGAGSRVRGDGLLDDEAIGDQLADSLARVGVGDLADLIGIQPDLVLANAQDGRREALLGREIDPEKQKQQCQPTR